MKITTEFLLRLQRLLPGNRLKFFLIFLADLVGARYTILRFDPTAACNLRCRMCYFSNPAWRHAHPARLFNGAEIERLAREFFPTALQLYIGCGAEPTLYKDYPDIVTLARRYRVPFISLVSNGQLITPAHLERLADAGLDELVLSVHGVTRESYEGLMTRASFDTVLSVLTALEQIRGEPGRQAPRLRLNYTVNPDNLAELDRFFDVFGGFSIHTIQLRPIIAFEGAAYVNPGLDTVLEPYRVMMATFKERCAARGIILLYNDLDPTYAQPNPSAPVYDEGACRIINPEQVWQPEFDWPTETYAGFKKRIGFRKRMLGYALGTIRIDYRASSLNSSRIL
jgi:sulfatase maturation enzyme AslB (radical SAM superfamily)